MLLYICIRVCLTSVILYFKLINYSNYKFCTPPAHPAIQSNGLNQLSLSNVEIIQLHFLFRRRATSGTYSVHCGRELQLVGWRVRVGRREDLMLCDALA